MIFIKILVSAENCGDGKMVGVFRFDPVEFKGF